MTDTRSQEVRSIEDRLYWGGWQRVMGACYGRQIMLREGGIYEVHWSYDTKGWRLINTRLDALLAGGEAEDEKAAMRQARDWVGEKKLFPLLEDSPRVEPSPTPLERIAAGLERMGDLYEKVVSYHERLTVEAEQRTAARAVEALKRQHTIEDAAYNDLRTRYLDLLAKSQQMGASFEAEYNQCHNGDETSCKHDHSKQPMPRTKL